MIPDITFALAKENAEMALFSPYDIERIYGKAFGDVAISALYHDLVADDRIRKKYITPAISSRRWPKFSLSPAIRTSCMKIRSTVRTRLRANQYEQPVLGDIAGEQRIHV